MIESFLPESVKIVLMGIIALAIVLSALARKLPNVAWLQFFRLQDNRTEEQKRRARRSGDILGGLEMIMAGVAVPAVYLVGSVMFFNDPTRGTLLLVGAISVVLIALGVGVIVKTARSNR
jgi:hypothetical protein